jgi:hypothetical protein
MSSNKSYGIDPFAADDARGGYAPPPQDSEQSFFDSSSANKQYAQQNTPYSPSQGSHQQPQWTDHNVPAPAASGGSGVPGAGAPPNQPTAAPTQQEEYLGVEATTKFWTIQFYQQFFDVDTNQVLLRLANTLIPIQPPDFLMRLNWHYNAGGDAAAPREDAGNQPLPTPSTAMFKVDGVTLNANPDLYGPVWLSTTLWMGIGIVGNLLSKIAHGKAEDTLKATNPTATMDAWNYDFTVASIAAATVYAYVGLMSLAVWGVMKWKGLPVTLVHSVALFGYSMFPFLLACIICAIPVTAIQWLACVVALVMSLAYLLLNCWSVWKSSLERTWFFGILVFVSTMHFGLACALKLYFFNY